MKERRSGVDRRRHGERRSGIDRRKVKGRLRSTANKMGAGEVIVEKRSGADRRSGKDQRSGKNRRQTSANSPS